MPSLHVSLTTFALDPQRKTDNHSQFFLPKLRPPTDPSQAAVHPKPPTVRHSRPRPSSHLSTNQHNERASQHFPKLPTWSSLLCSDRLWISPLPPSRCVVLRRQNQSFRLEIFADMIWPFVCSSIREDLLCGNRGFHQHSLRHPVPSFLFDMDARTSIAPLSSAAITYANTVLCIVQF